MGAKALIRQAQVSERAACGCGFKLPADSGMTHHRIGRARHRGLPAHESRGKAPWPDELHWKPQFVNLVEIISTTLAWRERLREELVMKCQGTLAAV
jgi:hypothetical protein